jgi:hypothetical protein
MTSWLLFVYRVPNEPSARRVYIWRKLKALGALLLQDAIWVLPETPQTREQLQWLTTEVRDMEGGEATLWHAAEVFTGQDNRLVQQFSQYAHDQYQSILNELDQADADLPTLAKRYQHTKRLDYFHVALGETVRQRLLEQKG